MTRFENPSRKVSSGRTLIRFCARLIVLVVFSAFGGIGFGKSLAILLAMSAILCTVVAAARREAPFGDTVNHWDETLVYAALYCLIIELNLSAPA